MRKLVMKKVHFYYLDIKFSLRDRKKLKTFIENIFIWENVQLLSLNYIFCSDDFLQKINKEFLNHEELTDIISFDMSNSARLMEGEIYVSIDRVKENAFFEKVKLKEELHRVILHGVLHLCGYKDKKKSDILIMRKKEKEYLDLYFS